MWFSQLAYETGQPETIDNAKLIWQFDSIKTVAKHVHFQSSTKSHRKFSLDTRGVIGTKGDLMVIGFGGTDALVWNNIATGIDFLPDTETIFLGCYIDYGDPRLYVRKLV